MASVSGQSRSGQSFSGDSQRSSSTAAKMTAGPRAAVSAYALEALLGISAAPPRLKTQQRKVGLSLPTITLNLRAFTQKSTPLFWFQDNVEATLTWDDPAWTVFCMGVYALVVLYPLRLLPAGAPAILVYILVQTHNARFPDFPRGQAAQASAAPKKKKGEVPPALSAVISPAEVLRISTEDVVRHPPGESKALPPVVAELPHEGSMQYYENVRDIQNMCVRETRLHLEMAAMLTLTLTQRMAMIAAAYDAGAPIMPYINWSSYNFTLVLMQLSIVASVAMFFLGPYIPLQPILLIGGEALFILTHPYFHPAATALARKVGESEEGKLMARKNRAILSKVQELIDMDRLSDEVWERGWKQVEMFENQRWMPLSSASQYRGSASTDGQDGWTAASNGTSGAGWSVDVSKVDMNPGEGWAWVDGDDWRIDWVGAWSDVGADEEGFVYTDASWQRPSSTPYGHANAIHDPSLDDLEEHTVMDDDGASEMTAAQTPQRFSKRKALYNALAGVGLVSTNGDEAPPSAGPVIAETRRRRWSRSTDADHVEAQDELPVTYDFGRLTLRDYQAECVQECLRTLASGQASRIGVSSPTGSGKTTMFSALLSALPNRRVAGSATRQGTQVLVVVSSIALATQTARAISHAFPQLHVELEQGRDYHSTGLADVTVATAQTLSRSPDRLEKFNPDHFKGVIVDEAHHAAAPSYVTILSHFDPQVAVHVQQRSEPDSPQSTRLPIIGFSATFARHDGIALGKVFQRIVYHKDFLEMVNANWLAPVRFTTVRTSLDLTSIPTSSRSHDFQTSALGEAMNTRALNQVIVRTWLDRATDHKDQASTSSNTTDDEERQPRRSTLVFAVNVAHVIDLTQAFRDAGIDARYVHGGQRPSFREQVIREFREGVFPVLVNCAVLTEGADIPPIDCLILARPTKSRNVFMQMLGRGLRLSPETNKKDCLVLDIVGATERGVVCTPTLFGLDISDIIENESMDDLRGRAEEAAQMRDALLNESMNEEGSAAPPGDESQASPRLPRKVTYIDYDSPEALQAAMLGDAFHLGYGSPQGAQAGDDGEAGQLEAAQAPSRSEPYIPVEKLSSNAWVDCGQGVFVLEIPPREGYVKIRKIGSDTGDEPDPAPDQPRDETSNWVAHHYPRNLGVTELNAASHRSFSRRRGGAAFLLRPRLVLHAATLDAAIRGTDTYVERSILHGAMSRVALCRRRAGWRANQATAPQRELIRKRLGYHKLVAASGSGGGGGSGNEPAEASADPDPLAHLTKGQAATILTRVTHGAKTRWQAAARAHNRRVKEQERLQKRTEVESEKARRRLERLEQKEREIERRRTGDVRVGDL
ncbi:putative ATP-dependent helicase IRC3 [Tilletia horrida]|uniref:ATP-dependent helicase IRC3 n=1 Tax=Tilletia horrida TaxID=155126 RepID=A0AAN6GRF7_9BASI|nr:putative ATP-dependent helicase IRC3 [Tilletia horrida]